MSIQYEPGISGHVLGDAELTPGEHQRIAIREKLLKGLPKEKPPFLICRRGAELTDLSNFMPWDAIQDCRCCATPVVYDRRAAPDSTPRICLPCALALAETGTTELIALSDNSKYTGLTDEQCYNRLQAQIANNNAGYVKPGAPTKKKQIDRRKRAVRGRAVQ